MQNEFDFISEEILSHTKQMEYYKKCLQEEGAKIQALVKKKNNINRFEKGKLCYFYDGYTEDNKLIRPMIRPYHHTENRDGKERHYSADWEDHVIGHGWKYCKLVTLASIVGRIINE